MLVCAGDIEQVKGALPIGIGLVNSAMNLTRFCMLTPPEFILFVGTAGSYGNCKPFDIIHSKVAANVEQGFLKKTCYTPLDNIVSASDDVSHETIVNSSNYITASKEISQEYLKLNLELENMEFYSVLSVAREFKIPVGGLFVVTNCCYENAHEEFKANHKEAIAKLENYLEQKGLINE